MNRISHDGRRADSPPSASQNIHLDGLQFLAQHDHSHVHGVCVLDRYCFAAKQAFRTPAELFGRDGNVYFNLINGQEHYLIHPIDL
ncbi:hypothetical protein, partial [Bradyrhizobium sp. USDA 3458]|uniref:hypothetical protein n=1 Tax=Bradyrhizobium sp. USDA 3458 TaxID=2591461 RepID=UPI001AEDB5A2